MPAAEVYPSSVRSTAHGMSAAVGKLGALAPTIFFNYIGNRAKFWAVCWAGLLGFLVTVVFVPDATGTHFNSHQPHWSQLTLVFFVLCLLKKGSLVIHC